MRDQQMNPGIYTENGPSGRGFARSRLHNFGLTMVVMGASFFLYYLGLFGTVDGPLTPANMGTVLSGMGVTRQHVIVVLLSILIFAISWNWVFNLTSALIGARMTCKAADTCGDGFCGAPVKRVRHISKRTGQTVVEYVCPSGHRRSEAHFHPIKKGSVSNTVWMACLAFVLIAAFCG
jgi:hypothetical protein